MRSAAALLALAAAAAPAAVWRPPPSPPGACATADDCSLNGDCVNATCACDPQWSGSAACDVLALLPADKASGYHNASAASWGGMSIRDPATGAWHLFASEMVGGCGLGSWKTNSRIIRAQGGAPAGPFGPPQAVSPPFSHNVKVFQSPTDGAFLLFSIGTGLWSTTPEACDAAGGQGRAAAAAPSAYPGPTGDGCGGGAGQNGGCGLSLGVAPSPEGPWAFSGINVTGQAASALLDCAHTNPSPWLFANGSILMAVNAGYCHGGLETIGLLSAPSYRGPWSYFSVEPILRNADGSPHRCEDPYLWWTPRGFHLMVHNQQGAGVARYAHSADARSWVLHDAPGPYDGAVAWSDGSQGAFDVERPQFVLDPGSGSALYLTNGAQGSGRSFTLFRPLRTTPPPPPPPLVALANAAGQCLAPAGAFPCWSAPAGFGVCPLVLGASCAPAWRLLGAAIVDAAGRPINVDCDSCAAGAGAKLISSGASPLRLLPGAALLQVAGCAAPAMCLSGGSGNSSGARAPCGGGSEPWLPQQVHLVPCADASAVGWRAL
jgi:hypothetical protein